MKFFTSGVLVFEKLQVKFKCATSVTQHFSSNIIIVAASGDRDIIGREHIVKSFF